MHTVALKYSVTDIWMFTSDVVNYVNSKPNLCRTPYYSMHL